MVFIFLAYFTLYNGLQFHPSFLTISATRKAPLGMSGILNVCKLPYSLNLSPYRVKLNYLIH